jgi:phosphotransferase system HPr (HPr) family protein
MPTSSEPQQVTDGAERVVVLPKHLHARPAGQVAQAAAGHREATIELVAGNRRANARSVLAVMGLGAVSGSEVRVVVTGPAAEAVADQVVEILCRPEADPGH